VPGIERLARAYFQLAISDVGIFEATIAQVEASSAVQSGIRSPTKEVMAHHGRALTHLQSRLADPLKRMQDLTFHIIVAIMSTHFFFSELEQHQAHLRGLWTLIEIRGGIDTLEPSLKQTIETVTSFVNYQTKTRAASTASSDGATTDKSPAPALDYPTHPFSPAVSLAISKLPIGFSDLALQRTFSIQSIDLLGDVQEQEAMIRASKSPETPSSRRRLYTADKCLHLLRSTAMPDMERMAIGGLLAYTVQSQPEDIRTTMYDDALKAFLAELAHYTFFNYEHPSLLWTVICFAALQSHLAQGSRIDFFHHTVLRFRQSSKWSRMEQTLKKFLWTDQRLDEWESAWRDAIGNHRPGGDSRTPSKSPEPEGAPAAGAAFIATESTLMEKVKMAQTDEPGMGVIKMEE
jgi:hypothetical protein